MDKKYDFFWNTMELCDWDKDGNDDKVLKPVIKYLTGLDDSEIFKFDDLMTGLLYELDTKELAELCDKISPPLTDDTFLYSRCVALINGPVYYENALKGSETSLWSMEFESLLYVPQTAWAKKHKRPADEYPHMSPLSYETGSNTLGWK